MPAKEAACLAVDLRLYSVAAVHAAVYRFAEFGCRIQQADWDSMSAVVAFTPPDNDAAFATLIIRFQQELTDQTLREQIRAETEDVRNVILAHAFSASAIAEK